MSFIIAGRCASSIFGRFGTTCCRIMAPNGRFIFVHVVVIANVGALDPHLFFPQWDAVFTVSCPVDHSVSMHLHPVRLFSKCRQEFSSVLRLGVHGGDGSVE